MVTRVLYFVYGCFAYLLFLATFLYAIAFVGGFGVPTSLDGRATAPLTSALAVDALLLGVFAVQHSVPYRFVRHPLYLGFILAFWAAATMTAAHLVFALATTAYIVLAIQCEEHDLAREHGHAYEEYRRTVPMLVPVSTRARRVGTLPSTDHPEASR